MESGSQKVLKTLDKGIDITRAEEVISLLRKYNICFRIPFMSATPNEKLSDTMKTLKLIKNFVTEIKRQREQPLLPGGNNAGCHPREGGDPDARWFFLDSRLRGNDWN